MSGCFCLITVGYCSHNCFRSGFSVPQVMTWSWSWHRIHQGLMDKCCKSEIDNKIFLYSLLAILSPALTSPAINQFRQLYTGKQTFCVADTGKGHSFAILWKNFRLPKLRLQYTVKAGNVVTFFAQNNFFLIILCRWPIVVCYYKIWLQNVLDVGKAIFGFCQHLGPFFKKMLGWRHYPPVG